MSWRPALRFCLCLLLWTGALNGSAGAEESLSAAEIAAAMKATSVSDGFQLRMRITGPEGSSTPPLNIVAVGQFGANRARLTLRTISSGNMSKRKVVATHEPGGNISAVSYPEIADGPPSTLDPNAKLFGTQLVLSDMFASWWEWRLQSMGERDRVAGRDCIIVHSRSATQSAPITEVDSCVDTKGQIAMRVQIFGTAHTLLRTLAVEKVIHKQTGSLAAKRLTVLAPDGSSSTVEVYDGDEQYTPAPGTFAPFN